MSDSPYAPPNEPKSNPGEGGGNLKRWLWVGVKFTIPAAIISFLLWNVDSEQWQALSQHDKNYPLLAAALLVAIAALAISFARWCLLVRCQGIDLTMLEAQRLGAICFLLSFVSAGSVGGDLFKAIFLAKRRPGKRVEAIASVLVDRGVGLYGLLIIVAAALLLRQSPLSGKEMDYIKTATAVLFSSGTIVLCLLVFGGKIVDRLIEWGSGLPLVGGLVEKIGPPLRMFHHHPLAFGVSIVMSVGVHSLLVISMYLIARGLYADPPTLAEHFVIVPFGLLVSALPLTPAGMGLLEATIDRLYKVVPSVATKASGTLVALVFELVKILMAIIGTVFYWTANEEVRESLEEASDDSDEPDQG